MDYYQFYRTPHLTVQKKDGLANILLSDCRALLREPLPESATEEELVTASLKEITFLVVRDLINIMPLLREQDKSQPHIVLPMREMDKIRRIGFLRGHIPYLTQAVAGSIGKKYWKIAKKMPKHPPEVFNGNLSNINAYSCDWICGELPENLHSDIYANGKPGGGRGFNREDIFVVADELGVVISSIPQHPLEKTPIRVEVGLPKLKPDLKNELPKPPEGALPAQVAAKYPIDKNYVLKKRESEGGMLSDKTFQGIVNRIKMDAREELYRINDKPANRYVMMQYIPWAITEGKTLRDICQGINGTPSMLEIAKWLQYYPDFRRELEAAESIQAHTFMDQAHELVMGLQIDTDKQELAVAKFQSNFLMKRAALQSEKFREKKVIQTENIDNKNEAEIKRKLKMLLRGEAVSDFIDVEVMKPEIPSVPEFEDQNAE